MNRLPILTQKHPFLDKHALQIVHITLQNYDGTAGRFKIIELLTFN